MTIAAVMEVLVAAPLRAAAGRPPPNSTRSASLHPAVIGQVRRISSN